MPFYVSGHILFLHILQPSIYMVSCQGIWRAFFKPDLYCNSPVLFKSHQPYVIPLYFLDVSEHTVHFSGVPVGNLHPTHQCSKAPISPWPVLHFWFGHFFPHGPFARWEARHLWSADWPFQVAWLAKKDVGVFS